VEKLFKLLSKNPACAGFFCLLTCIFLNVELGKLKIMSKNKGLTHEWKEFAESWISFMENYTPENKERLLKAVANYRVRTSDNDQKDWVWETKQIIEKIPQNDRSSWKKIFNFIKERYAEHDYHNQILKIAEKKGVGEFVWTL
jgi:hypothetical protein